MIRLLLTWVLLAGTLAHADSTANRYTEAGISVFTNAYRSWDGALFNESIKLFEKACREPSANCTNYYWLGIGEFHYALNLLGSTNVPGNKSAAGVAFENAIGALTRVVQLDNSNAESHALLGTIYGMKISENWLRALTLGPKVQKEFKLAKTLGTNDARVLYLLGTSQYYCASSYDSRREALDTLLAGEKLFELESKTPVGPLEPQWGHDSCLTFIGLCYEKLGQRSEAEAYFHRSLALHPEDGLARAGLSRVIKK